MTLSGNQKLGALLAGILPLVTSIYGQQAERREQNQARAIEQQARVDADRRAAEAADSASARQLYRSLVHAARTRGDAGVTDETCSRLHMSLRLVQQDASTPKTEAVVAAFLTYRPEGEDRPRLMVCDCSTVIEGVGDDWDAPGRSEDQRLHARLLGALVAAKQECNPAAPLPVVAVAAELPPVPSPPPPSAPAPATATPAPAPSPAATPGEMPAPAVEPSVEPAEPSASAQAPAPPSPTKSPDTSVAPAQPAGTEAGTDSLRITSPRAGARIYFQVPSSEAQSRIAPLRSSLERAGYRVHEIENVGEARSPKCAELRYVYGDDTPEANVLLGDLNAPSVLRLLYGTDAPAAAEKGTGRGLSLKQMSRYQGRALNRVYELWLPAHGGKDCKS